MTEIFNTDLDKELHKLAVEDWPGFVNLIGVDNITAAKVCLLKKKGKSISQIASKFKRKKGYARWIIDNKCKACVVENN